MDEAQGHKAMNKLWRCCCGLASSKTLARAKEQSWRTTLNSHSRGRNSRRRLPAQRLRTIPRQLQIHYGRCGRRRSRSN